MTKNNPTYHREVAFMGKMAARMTHEMRNILSIIKESSGLVEDVLSMNRDVEFKKRELMERSLDRIDEQIPRGLDLLSQFNRMAHSMDDPEARIEISDFLEHLTALMACFARLKKVDLEYIPAGTSISINTDPFRLLWIFSTFIEYMLEETTEGSSILLRTQAEQNALYVYILSSSDIPSPSELEESLPAVLSYFASSLEDLGIRAYTCVAPGKNCLVLVIAC